MRLWIERGFSRLPIAERMLIAEPTLQLYTNPRQTPKGATVLASPRSTTRPSAEINRVMAEHHIDAFWPQNSAKCNLGRVTRTVHAAGPPEIIALVDDKTAFSHWLGDDPMRADAVEVEGVDALETEVRARQDTNRVTCVKPVIGVNGNGYWKLTADGNAGFLDDPEPREIGTDIYVNAVRLSESNTDAPKRRMLVMDWLPGPEVSVDLLCWKGVPLIQAARTKIDANHQRIEGYHAVVPHARDVAERLRLHGVVSMQYRLDSTGNWRMLEVNPRPAGGSIHSEDAGFGILAAWARLIAGTMEPEDAIQKQTSCLVVFRRSAHVLEQD